MGFAASLHSEPEARTTETILGVRNVSLSFKGIQALNELSFDVARGEICALIGPNGAGKSSLLNVINGIYRADAGKIVFDGRPFDGISPLKAARRGIGRTFQHNALFARLSVLENVLAGLARHSRTTLFENAFGVGRAPAESHSFQKRAQDIIHHLDLAAYGDAPVSTLPYGVQKRVDLARALVGRPSLLLLDEPMAGMNHEEKREMSRLIAEINRATGTSIVLIEHDIAVVMNLSHHVVVLDYGRKVGDGEPEEVRHNPEVIAAYLGTVH